MIITLSSITESPAFPAFPVWMLITGIATLVTGAATILILIVLNDRTNRRVSLRSRHILSMARQIFHRDPIHPG